MERKFLKDLELSDELVEKIISEHGKSVQEAQASLKSAQDAKTQAEEALAERDKQLETLKESSKDNETLTQTIKDLQEKNEQAKKEADARLQGLQKSYAIEKALTESGALNVKATQALLNLDAVTVGEDGSIVGLSEQVEKVKSENEFLFRKQEETPKPKITGTENTNTETTNDDYLNEILAKYKK